MATRLLASPQRTAWTNAPCPLLTQSGHSQALIAQLGFTGSGGAVSPLPDDNGGEAGEGRKQRCHPTMTRKPCLALAVAAALQDFAGNGLLALWREVVGDNLTQGRIRAIFLDHRYLLRYRRVKTP